MKRLIKIFIFTFLSSAFIILSCKKEEEKTINTDISVTSSTNLIVWLNQNDLNSKIQTALTYNYGESHENEIEKTIVINTDSTSVIATINFKNEFSEKYHDPNLSNNTVVIELKKSIQFQFENNNNNPNDYTINASPWDHCHLTYSFINYTNDITEQEQINGFEEATNVWANAVPNLTFENIGYNNNNADIMILFTSDYNHPPCPSEFSQGTIAHGFYPYLNPVFSGDIHFNDNFNFTSNNSFPDTDFITIAIHELGHALGLGHTNVSNAIMYPTYSNGTLNRHLSQDDIDGIIALYGNPCSNINSSSISLAGNLNFGNVEIGQSPTRTFTISNTGNQTLHVSDINFPYNVYSANWTNGSIAPNNSQTVTVTFQPTNQQSYNGNVEVISDASNGNNTIAISGTGYVNNTSNISLSGNLNFGNLPIGQTDTRTFTISNTGNQSFYVSSINFPYSVYSANWNSGTINPNSSQTVTVTFQPTYQQSYNGNVTVISNATSGNNTIPISGTGINNNTGQPNLVYSDYRIVSDHNNNNGIVEAGEDIDFDIQVHNIGNATAHNVEVYIDTNNSYINISDHDRDFNDVTQGSYEWNTGNLDFQVDPNCPSGPVYFTAHFTSDEGSWYSNFSIDVQAQSGNNPIPITPTNSCYDAPTLDINTEYIVNLDLSDGTIGYAPPIDGVSYNGADVQGFWLKFYEPSGYVGPLNIKIYDVSNNFDPVIGHKYSCSGIFYTQWNSSSFVANDNSYGGSETFADYSNNNGYTHRIRIYHYYGYEQNNISFKIKIEQP